MKYYLVRESKLFVDAHGEAEDGGITKRVEYTDRYEGLDLSLVYNEDLEEVEDDYDGSEDGYNAEYIELEIKEITEGEASVYVSIIKEYESL